MRRKFLLIVLGIMMAALSIALLFNSSRNGRVHAQEILFAPAPGSPIALAGSPTNVLFGDFNSDEKLDLIVPTWDNRSITLLIGQGNGTFNIQSEPIVLPEVVGEMAAGDINGDDLPDLAITSHDSYNIALLLGDGKGGFIPAPESPFVMKDGEHPHTHGLGLDDLNGDMYLDLVTANHEDDLITIAFGNGKGGFTHAETAYPVSKRPYPLTVGDVNNDGHLDIISTSTAESSHELTVLVNNGSGLFKANRIILKTPHPWYTAVGDINGDDKTDIVATHSERSELTVLLGNTNGTFTEVSNSPFDLGHSAWRVAVKDVDYDGHADVLAAADKGVRILLGDGTGSFAPAPGSPYSVGNGAWRLAMADVNGDGKLDIATSNLESQSVSILLAQ